MKKYLIVIIVFTNYQSSMCQKILSDIELFYLSDLFKNAHELNIYELIEKDKNLDITRKWEFNSDGNILNEIDFREMGFLTLIEENIVSESKTSRRELFYEYDENGILTKLLEKKIFNNELILTEHKFNYEIENTIIENWKSDFNEISKMESKIVTKFLNEKIDTIYIKSCNFIGERFVESIQTNVHNYNLKGQLETKISFTQMNAMPKQIKIKETRNSKIVYKYDQLDNIQELIEYEFDDNNKPKIRRTINFKYNTDLSILEEIQVHSDESYLQQDLNYKLNFNSNGIIKEVIVGDKKYIYEVMQRK